MIWFEYGLLLKMSCLTYFQLKLISSEICCLVVAYRLLLGAEWFKIFWSYCLPAIISHEFSTIYNLTWSDQTKIIFMLLILYLRLVYRKLSGQILFQICESFMIEERTSLYETLHVFIVILKDKSTFVEYIRNCFFSLALHS